MQQARAVIQTLGLSADAAELRSAQLAVAFQHVCETRLQAVYAYVRYRVPDPQAAEDLAARTFLRALERLHTFDSGRGELIQWIFGIARHVVQDHVRERRRWAWIPLERLSERASRDATPEVALAASEEHQRLAAALARLADRERDLLGLKFAGGLTNREIAQVTGLRESHVGVIVFRAISRLREHLGTTGGHRG